LTFSAKYAIAFRKSSGLETSKGTHMARANRQSWERESFLDDLYGVGITKLPRHKFVYLSGQTNMCQAVLKTWLDHWREYMEDQDEDVEILLVGESVVLWRDSMVQKNGGPKSLSDALASQA
jgi:hypothetical protein